MSIHDRGFASMSPEKRAEISRLGGQTAHKLGRAHQWTKGKEAEAAGRAGGHASGASKLMARLARRKAREVARKAEAAAARAAAGTVILITTGEPE